MKNLNLKIRDWKEKKQERKTKKLRNWNQRVIIFFGINCVSRFRVGSVILGSFGFLQREKETELHVCFYMLRNGMEIDIGVVVLVQYVCIIVREKVQYVSIHSLCFFNEFVRWILSLLSLPNKQIRMRTMSCVIRFQMMPMWIGAWMVRGYCKSLMMLQLHLWSRFIRVDSDILVRCGTYKSFPVLTLSCLSLLLPIAL